MAYDLFAPINYRLFLGDCLDAMRSMGDGCIDLTVTSPPYDNLRTYNDSLNDWNESKWRFIFTELFRVTKTGGVVVWVVGDATIDGSETGTSFRQALDAKNIGFNLHDTMIYKKTNPGIAGSNYCYLNVFEYMFIFSKGRPIKTNFIYDRKNVRSGMTTAGSARRNVNGEVSKTRRFEQSEFGKRFNIWEYPTGGKGSGHPAPFPEALARDHILSWSNECDMVFDPFLGSGTTGKMAMLHNRKFIGVERDPTYFTIAQKRIGAVA